MDTSDPEIIFDTEGVCNHCAAAVTRIEAQLLPLAEREVALQNLVATIKREGAGKPYDCVIGVSGGVDSTTVALLVRRLGLRPLAVHFDNGWNSELAVDNITKTLTELDIDLLTHVVDWDEFRDLQLAFIKASVANAEAPTDHGIAALLFQTALANRVRFVLSGSNIVSEAIMPLAWGHFHQDARQLKAIHRRFGTLPIKTMPTVNVGQYLYYVFGRRLRQIPFLNYIDYERDSWKKELSEAVGWRDYGGKHYESVWTRFFQGYYLPTKFGFDKRRAHLSTLICSGQLRRDEALSEIMTPPYPDQVLLEEDFQFVLKKLGLSKEEFESYLAAPGKKPTDYPSHDFLFRRLHRYKNLFRKVATTP